MTTVNESVELDWLDAGMGVALAGVPPTIILRAPRGFTVAVGITDPGMPVYLRSWCCGAILREEMGTRYSTCIDCKQAYQLKDEVLSKTIVSAKHSLSVALDKSGLFNAFEDTLFFNAFYERLVTVAAIGYDWYKSINSSQKTRHVSEVMAWASLPLSDTRDLLEYLEDKA